MHSHGGASQARAALAARAGPEPLEVDYYVVVLFIGYYQY